MRDWAKAMRRASFRGVSFWVDGDGPDVGRRVAVHEISGGETVVTEDMGRRARGVTVAAYLASDRADREALTLEVACEMPGPSLLILPMDPPRLMHCLGCRRDRRKDRAGFVGYDLDFVEVGIGGVAGTGGLSALRGTFERGAGGAAAAIAAIL